MQDSSTTLTPPTTASALEAPANSFNPAAGTNLCNHCVTTEADVLFTGLSFDTEKDCQTAFLWLHPQTIVDLAVKAWDAAWNDFQCTNKLCQSKRSCSPKPKYVEIGVEAQAAPAGAVWCFYCILDREIQCVADAQGKDDAPDLSDVLRPRDPQSGKMRTEDSEVISLPTISWKSKLRKSPDGD